MDHSGTRNSQDIEWDINTPGMNNNIRHSMRSNAVYRGEYHGKMLN